MDQGIQLRVESIGRERIISDRLSAKAPIRHLDFALCFAAFALSAVGALFVYSATRVSQQELGLDPRGFLKRQLLYILVGTMVFIGALLFDYRQLRGFSPLLYGASFLLLLVVLTPLGTKVSGAQRWIDLGVFQVQPSEIMKIALVILLATIFGEDKPEAPAETRMPLAIGLTALPALVIYFQPDLGTLMVLPAILFGILLVAGVRARWLIALMLTGVVSFVAVLNLGLMRDYQLARLTALLDPQSDPQRAGYNLEQSKIAIGAGGFNGRGLFQGTQTNLDYVPEQHTDFIFTAIGEELGFVGSMLVVGLFCLLIWRGLRIAMISKDDYGTLLAAGISVMFAFQMFVNIGMTVGIMPITGIPLPLVSFGGSSMLVSFASVGLLLNVHMRRFS